MSTRRQFSFEDKLSIICLIENGERNSVVAKEFGANRSTISAIWKNREIIKKNISNTALSSKHFRTASHPELDHALLKWFQQQRSQKNPTPMNCYVLQEKVNRLGALLNLGQNFQCSLSWIQRFKNRHDIVFGKISGESAAVNVDECGNWLQNVWPKIRDGYGDGDVFNADEAGLFYKMTPHKTLRFRNEPCSGGKLSKERVTEHVGD